MSLELYQVTLGLAVLMLVLEMFTGAFFFVGFAVGLASVALVHAFSGSFSFGRDVALFAVVSALAFFGLRKIFRRDGDSSAPEEDVNRY